MARPKKTQKRGRKPRTSAKSATSAKSGAKKTPRGKAKSKSANKAKTAKQTKGLQTLTDNIIIRRPSPNPQPDIELINMITTDLHSIMEALDEFAANLRALDRCRKAKGFSAWSLRYAQTPHIIRGVLPKAKLLSYPA